jgi:hypothetical protein
MQRTGEDNIPINVEFICAACKGGKHGCAKRWRGHGLEICCCCSCTALGGITLSEEKQLDKEGRHEENNSVMGQAFQSKRTTTSTLNRPAYKEGGLRDEG